MAPKKDAAIAASLARARAIGSDLSKKTDELNGALLRTEKHLKALNLGAEGWIEITNAVDTTEGRTALLGFGKTSSGWKLLVQFQEIIGEGSRQHQLLSMSRDFRVRAAAHIPTLVEQLVEEAERQLKAIDAAVESLAGIAEPPEEAAASQTDYSDDEIPF